MSYSGILQNSLTAKQDEFIHKSLIKDWRNGMKHSIPISATFNVLKYINVTPSVQLTDRMYTTKVRRHWDPAAMAEVCDTSYSFYNVWDFQASVSLDTKLYGFYQPMKFLGDKVKMIRHVLTPSISFSGNPDFSSSFFGYYGQYQYQNTAGETMSRKYSYFPNAVFGVPGQGKAGSLSFSLAKQPRNEGEEQRQYRRKENLAYRKPLHIAKLQLRRRLYELERHQHVDTHTPG